MHKPIRTKIVCFDQSNLKSQFAKIRTYPNHFIYNDYRMIDVMILRDSGKYDYIFIPNIPTFVEDHEDCIDEFIF